MSDSEAEHVDASLFSTCLNTSRVYFVERPDEKYCCASCGKILEQSVLQTPCGHRISAKCADLLFKDSDSVACPGNEDGCERISKTQGLHPDRATEKELKRMRVYCSFKYKGCRTVTTWAKLDEHDHGCEFRVIHCRNPGCDAVMNAAHLEHHEQIECIFRQEKCEQCELVLSKKELENGHYSECKPVAKKCPLHKLGCPFQGVKEQLEKHLVSSHIQHIEIGVQHLLDLQNELASFRSKIESHNFEIESIKQSVKSNPEATQAIQTLSAGISSIKLDVKGLEQTLKSKTDLNGFLELKESVTNLSDRIGRTETQVAYIGQGPNNSQQLERITLTVSRLETSLGSQAGQIAESDLRFRLIETASFDGKLIWKITQYTRRKQDAIDERTMSLYSQPFYTCHHGYKMCGRVYLNGDGLGKGSHLSVFFVIMHGEYDALLTWPFRQKVTLTLLDQSGNRRHISDSFRPDPTSSSFHRPRRDMNVASGSPLFATHAQVENDNFLQDDTLFIKISVDTTDMPEI